MPRWPVACVAAVVVAVAGACGQATPGESERPSATPALGVAAARKTLGNLVEDVTSATGYRYGLKDDLGHEMDGVKVLQVPESGGVHRPVSHEPGQHLRRSPRDVHGSPGLDVAGRSRAASLDADHPARVRRRVCGGLGAGAGQSPPVRLLPELVGSAGRYTCEDVRTATAALRLCRGDAEPVCREQHLPGCRVPLLRRLRYRSTGARNERLVELHRRASPRPRGRGPGERRGCRGRRPGRHRDRRRQAHAHRRHEPSR